MQPIYRTHAFDYRGFELEKRGFMVVDTYTENGIKQLQIIDILAESDDVLSVLLRFAINLGHEWACTKIKLWLTSDRYKSVLEENGFVYGDHPFAMTVMWANEIFDSKHPDAFFELV